MASSIEQRYAGFWLRVTPAVLDLMVLGLALGVFVSFLEVARGSPTAFLNLRPGDPPSAVIKAIGLRGIIAILGFFIVSGWLYYALLESSRWQGTLGKKFFGLYVTDTQGNRISFGRATRRYLCGHFWLCVPSIGGLYFTTDCICSGLTARKQALHDAITGCLVLRRDEGGARRE
ncbi:MAG: RDD family protein [Candidatus Acidiferrales bacterium]